MIDISKSIFLVDGQSEIRALKDKFTKDFSLLPSLRIVGCNGKGVSPEGYANAAYGTLALALRGCFTTIVCVLDREGRRQSALQVADKTKKAIIDRISTSSKYRTSELERKIHVCVPDIMFENWIVSDVEGIKQIDDLVRQDSSQEMYEGKSGCTALKRMMKVAYKKTLHGPRLFCSTRFDASKENSSSFKRFAEIIGL